MIFHFLRKMKAAKAIRTYQDAQARYRDAVSRGDCREQFHAHKALVAANTARLRVEVRG